MELAWIVIALVIVVVALILAGPVVYKQIIYIVRPERRPRATPTTVDPEPHATGYRPSARIDPEPHATGFDPATTFDPKPHATGFIPAMGLDIHETGYRPAAPPSGLRPEPSDPSLDPKVTAGGFDPAGRLTGGGALEPVSGSLGLSGF